LAHTEAILIVDTREHNPLLFPRILRVAGQGRVLTIRREALKCGDYALSAARTGCVIERKGSASEIITNMLDPVDNARQLRSFDKLAACDYPVLLLEQTPSALLTYNPRDPTHTGGDPSLAFDRLLEAVMSRGIHLLFVGSCNTPDRRIRVGELVARILLCHHERIRSPAPDLLKLPPLDVH
jgi:hypothetical protein